MKHVFRYACQKCKLSAAYLQVARHVMTGDLAIKFYVQCGCEPDQFYDTEEQAIAAFNKTNGVKGKSQLVVASPEKRGSE